MDGVCKCPENEVEEDGMCHPEVPCCTNYKNRECIETTEDTTLVDGKCVCADNDEMVDANGQCHPCKVPFCKTCGDGKCIVCKEGYVLKNGKCFCPGGNSIRPTGICDPTCNIPGCNKCSEDGKTCEECNDCNMKKENG